MLNSNYNYINIKLSRILFSLNGKGGQSTQVENAQRQPLSKTLWLVKRAKQGWINLVKITNLLGPNRHKVVNIVHQKVQLY